MAKTQLRAKRRTGLADLATRESVKQVLTGSFCSGPALSAAWRWCTDPSRCRPVLGEDDQMMRTEAGLAIRIIRLSTSTPSAASPC